MWGGEESGVRAYISLLPPSLWGYIELVVSLDLRSLIVLRWLSSCSSSPFYIVTSFLHSFRIKSGNNSADSSQVDCASLCDSSTPCPPPCRQTRY